MKSGKLVKQTGRFHIIYMVFIMILNTRQSCAQRLFTAVLQTQTETRKVPLWAVRMSHLVQSHVSTHKEKKLNHNHYSMLTTSKHQQICDLGEMMRLKLARCHTERTRFPLQSSVGARRMSADCSLTLCLYAGNVLIKCVT